MDCSVYILTLALQGKCLWRPAPASQKQQRVLGSRFIGSGFSKQPSSAWTKANHSWHSRKGTVRLLPKIGRWVCFFSSFVKIPRHSSSWRSEQSASVASFPWKFWTFFFSIKTLVVRASSAASVYRGAGKRTKWDAETEFEIGRENRSREVRSLCSWWDRIYPEVGEGWGALGKARDAGYQSAERSELGTAGAAGRVPLMSVSAGQGWHSSTFLSLSTTISLLLHCSE